MERLSEVRYKQGASLTSKRCAGAGSKALCFALLFVVTPALAGGLTVDNAWVAPNAEVGSDVGLFMTITNDADAPDALLRVACPFANFSGKRTVDVGEGGLAHRAIPNIPLAAHATLTMTSKSYHVGLLQTRDKLVEGQTLTCNLSFRGAGAMEVKVLVSPSAPKA
jgi:periplasmic copper chaperone A